MSNTPEPVSVVVSSLKPELVEGMQRALALYNSEDGAALQALRARGASPVEVCDWVNQASDPDARRQRKALSFVDAYRTPPDALRQWTTGDLC